MGESAGPAGTLVAFRAQVNDRTARVALLHNGTEMKSGYGGVDLTAPISPGPYRIEAYRPGTSVPWIVSNPIYTDGLAGRGGGRGDGPPPDALRLVPLPASSGWAVEKNATSTGASRADAKETRFDFSLGGGQPYDQFAALVSGIDPAQATEGFDRVRFTIRADSPCGCPCLRLLGARTSAVALFALRRHLAARCRRASSGLSAGGPRDPEPPDCRASPLGAVRDRHAQHPAGHEGHHHSYRMPRLGVGRRTGPALIRF